MIFIFYLLTFLHIAAAISFEEDMTITLEQKQILDKFKAIVSPTLPHSYMKTDIYLIRWLRVSKFNIKTAERMLEQNLKWRKDNNMDDIQDEHWDDFRTEYNYWIEGQDKTGRPIIYIDIGSWNIRRSALTGQSHKLIHAYDKIVEQVSVEIRKMQEAKLNVSQYYVILDMGSHNALQHGCGQCIAVLSNMISAYQTHYPFLCHKMVLANTPEAFKQLLSFVINPCPVTQEIIEIYGRGRKGQAALLNDIDADQLPIEVGGTRLLPDI